MKACRLCVVLCVTTLLYATRSVQLVQDQRQHAVCSLTLQGHANPKTLGVSAAGLHCTSSSPIPIGINSTYLSRFAPRFTGVQVITNLACQRQAKGYATVNNVRVPLFALLYFCGDYHVILEQPSVRNISLRYDDSAYDTAAVAFGASTEVNIHQGRFTGNSAGSALVAFEQATVSVSGGTVLDHNEGYFGAAIACFDEGKLVLRDTSLRYNHAQGSGGSVICADNASVNISNTAFTNNNAVEYGGGLYADSAAQVTIINSTWHNNTSGNGSALAMINTPSMDFSSEMSAVLSITGSTFINNSATDTGGGLYLEDYVQVIIVNSTWHNNTAAYGAGLSMTNTPSTGSSSEMSAVLSITGSTFINNSATDTGGGLYLEDYVQVVIVNSTWHNNTAAYGAGLSMTNTPSTGSSSEMSAVLSITGSTLINNNATSYGGGLCLEDHMQVIIVNSTWHNNTASQGAGLSMSNWDGLPPKLSITGSTFSHNNATHNGGGLCLEDLVQVIIVNSTWHSNAAYLGAGLSIDNTYSTGSSSDLLATLSITGSTFNNNNASNGGGLRLAGHVQADVIGSNLSANMADLGGAMYAQSTAAVVSSCIFSRNSATIGAGIYHYMVDNNLTFSESIMDQNAASHYGGGIAGGWIAEETNIGKLTVTAVNFTNNHAGIDGGALSIVGAASGDSDLIVVTITNSSFAANNAEHYGGGLTLRGLVQAHVSKDCNFIGNSAAWGGALSLQGQANLTISNSTMQGNSANAGGAMTQQDSTIALVTGSMILDNTAGSGGGILCQDNGQIAVTADTLVRNNSADTGGGLCAQGSASVFLKDITLYGNHAGSSGGGIELDGSAHAEVSNCSVIGNTAQGDGGGLFATSWAILTLTDSRVVNNTASGNGGGIRIKGTAKLQLLGDMHSYVTSNAAAGWGGGVSLSSHFFGLAQVKRAVQGNTAVFDSDISSGLTNIAIHGNTSVVGFVNSIGSDQGLLHVAINVSGYYGLPCGGWLVQATLNDGMFLGSNRSNEDGMTYMSFKVARPAGLYNVSFISPSDQHIPAAKLSLQIRGCIRGEVSPSPDSCQKCPQGYFSFNPQQAVRNTCPANANCTGGDVVLPLPGYWRSSANSTQVHRCLNPAACLISNQTALPFCAANSTCGTSNTFKDLQCSPDYTGNLCGVCAAGRGAIKLFVCKSCMATSHIIALYIIAAVVMLLFIKLLCFLTLNQARNVCLGNTSKLPAAELLRPLILYSQYMLIVSSMNIEWPATLSYPLKVLGWAWSPASPETLSIDCILPRNTSLPVSIQKVLFYVCMPVALLCILMLIEVASVGVRRMLLAKFTGRHATVVDLKDRLLSSTLVAVFFFLPSVLRTLFSMFACTQIDQPASAPNVPAAVGLFWVFDMNQQCFAGYHKAWALGLGLPLVLVICLGLPSYLLFLLLSNKSKLREELFMQQYGFLYKSFRDEFCCWECVIVCQTILLVATSVFGVNMGVFYQLIVIMGVLMLIGAMLLVFRPYLYPQAGRVMLQAICCLFLTSYVSLTFLQVGSVQPSPVYGMIMGSILLVMNLAFVVSVLWQLARLVDWQALVTIVQSLVQRLVHGLGLLSTPKVDRLSVPSKTAPAANTVQV